MINNSNCTKSVPFAMYYVACYKYNKHDKYYKYYKFLI